MRKSLILLSAIMGITIANSHDFYPRECCHDKDCYPTGEDKDPTEPDPIIIPGGFKLFDGTVIMENNARPSPDGRYHVCRHGGLKTNPVIKTSDGRFCAWYPVNGS